MISESASSLRISFQRGALPPDARLGTFCGPGCIRKVTGLPDPNLLNERIDDLPSPQRRFSRQERFPGSIKSPPQIGEKQVGPLLVISIS